jgi:hypothetical protein
MATNRLFTFNNGPTIGDALQYGNLSVSDYAIPGYKWWPGPDEDLGYVIAHDDTNPNMRTEGSRSATVSTNSVGFWRTSVKSNEAFLTMVNDLLGQNFVDGATATDWLLTNGYWTSYDPNGTLGTIDLPASSAQYLYDSGVTSNGWYYIQTSTMPEPRRIYCNMTDEGGGWMLMTYNPDLNTNYGNPYPNEWIGGEGSFNATTSNTIVAIGATSNPPNYPYAVNPPRTYSGKWTSIDVRDVWYNNGVAQCSKVMRMASTSDNKIPILSNMDVANKIIYSNPNNLKISATFSYKYVYDPILNATIWMTAKDGSTITLSGNNTVSMVGTWSSIIGYTILTNDIPITAPGDWMIGPNTQWNIVDSINPPSVVDQTQDIGGLTWVVPSPSNPGPYHMVSGQTVNDAQTFGLSDVGIGVDSERLDLRTLAIYIK